jgi:twitching motility protein PilT
MDIERLLKFAVEQGASDVHLQAGSPPMLRLGGQVRVIEGPPLSNDDILAYLKAVAPRHVADDVASAAVQGLDFAHGLPDGVRLRCSAFRTLSRFGLTMRTIRTQIPSIAELNLPKVVTDIALSRRGLTLVTGTTGSGKSTTLASMIDLINTNFRTKIITVEDPVEYLQTNKRALISQIEVGTDTVSFEQALRQALRQDPDVILIGELRDVETLRIALRAADTGHQVFGTVHSANAPQTVERIIAMFPPAEHKMLLGQLANSLEAILSQRLLVGLDGKRRPVVEILRGGPVAAKMIVEDRLTDLAEYVQTGEGGMQSFDQHLLQMHQAELVSGTEALRWASNPEALSIAMRGIRRIGGLK